MPKAVIFDMGGILLDFFTLELTAAYTDTPEDAALLERAVFRSPEWAALDRGVLTEDQVLAAVREGLPERLCEPAARVVEHWDEYLFPKPEMIALARELDGLGVPLYLLSNTSARFYRFREKMEVWPLLRGAVLSFEEKVLKPDPEIYRRVFARFGLAPGDCFFIDDLNLNIEAARWCGMRAFHYQNDISRLRAALHEAGIPIAMEQKEAFS